MGRIPTIDIAPLFDASHVDYDQTVQQVMNACTDIGFLSITGTGIPTATVENMRLCAGHL